MSTGQKGVVLYPYISSGIGELQNTADLWFNSSSHLLRRVNQIRLLCHKVQFLTGKQFSLFFFFFFFLHYWGLKSGPTP
jgi:hypothetical protein